MANDSAGNRIPLTSEFQRFYGGSLEQYRCEENEADLRMYAAWLCDHKRTEPRLVSSSNGTEIIRPQCLGCGALVGGAVARSAVQSRPLAADLFLNLQKREALQEVTERIIDRWHRARRGLYVEYLDSPEWSARRLKVLERERHTCQGCGAAKATQVHHVTYAHFGQEFLFELMALCEPCHHRYHED